MDEVTAKGEGPRRRVAPEHLEAVFELLALLEFVEEPLRFAVHRLLLVADNPQEERARAELAARLGARERLKRAAAGLDEAGVCKVARACGASGGVKSSGVGSVATPSPFPFDLPLAPVDRHALDYFYVVKTFDVARIHRGRAVYHARVAWGDIDHDVARNCAGEKLTDTWAVYRDGDFLFRVPGWEKIRQHMTMPDLFVTRHEAVTVADEYMRGAIGRLRGRIGELELVDVAGVGAAEKDLELDAPRVHVYRNLDYGARGTRLVRSVRDTGRVLGHVSYAELVGCQCRVQPAGRAKVLLGGPRNVHAYVVGRLVAVAVGEPAPARPRGAIPIRYDPRDPGRPGFHRADNGAAVEGARRVRFDEAGAWVSTRGARLQRAVTETTSARPGPWFSAQG